MNIKVISTTKTFNTLNTSFKACDNISLDINQGDFIAIVGYTGSGKSTLLSMIGGILKPTSGSIYYDSFKISDASESDVTTFRREYFSYIFQHPVIIPNMNIIDNIVMPLMFKNDITDEKIEQVKEYIKAFGLKSKQNMKAGMLSGGEMKKVSILRALVYGCDVLIADEPTNDLDPKTIKILVDIFNSINKKGTTVIMVTHSHSIASQAKTVYEMSNGKIIRTLK